ncbi:MAG: DEAD/DEAH box helicase family protein [Deltaproteobacteria bacterium]|nr:DEAD/DEAH box helicase family protein [Deltaproteobacteria bacterium]
MHLNFDRGTLVLHDVPSSFSPASLPEVRWDARTGSWRARACAWSAVRDELGRRGVPFQDRVATRHAPTGPWCAPALRPYQEEALAAWDMAGQRGIVVLPTGAGKTKLAVAALAETRAPALCLVPTRVLLHQWVATLREAGLERVGVLGDGERQLAPVTVATYESAWRQIEHIGARFSLLIVDEVHHFAGGARIEIFEACTAPRRLGLTATPVLDDEQLERLVGRAVFVLGIRQLQGTFLADFDVVPIVVELTANERQRYRELMAPFLELAREARRSMPGARFEELARAASASREGRLALEGLHQARALCALPEEKRAALRRLLQRTRDRRTLIFTGNNATAYAVAREHLVMPITCDIGRKERDTALAAFRAGRLRCLVSAQVLNEGLDVPDADVAVVLGGQRGAREHVQRVGRVLRPAPDKRAVVYELIARGTMEEGHAAKRARALAGGAVSSHDGAMLDAQPAERA